MHTLFKEFITYLGSRAITSNNCSVMVLNESVTPILNKFADISTAPAMNLSMQKMMDLSMELHISLIPIAEMVYIDFQMLDFVMYDTSPMEFAEALKKASEERRTRE